ncbi:MAG: hypothetical protein KatS3mg017_0119 [Fimbriimonadales bacterium]|nr:MAG: hypothetical protein KatS3mg017_0119 [Fimbriimonadales bacterium]
MGYNYSIISDGGITDMANASTVKEKVRINDTEFEITLKPVLPSTENDPMVLDQPLPTPDEILERVPSIEQLPRWEDGMH